MKKILSLVMVLALAFAMTGCGSSSSSSNSSSSSQTAEDIYSADTTEAATEATGSAASDGSTMDMTANTDAGYVEGFDQTAAPTAGDKVATISVEGYGDIKAVLFEDIAPYGTKNFSLLSQNGYYDGLTFHRVIDNFMIQGGDPLGNGTGGDSIWGTPIYTETAENACVIGGSLCYAKSSVDPSIGSQFFITQAVAVTEDDFTNYEQNYGLTFTDEQKKLYEENGGAPWLQGQYTVFGQVFEGMDIVNKIAAVATDENDKPTTDVVIKSITVEDYVAE